MEDLNAVNVLKSFEVLNFNSGYAVLTGKLKNADVLKSYICSVRQLGLAFSTKDVLDLAFNKIVNNLFSFLDKGIVLESDDRSSLRTLINNYRRWNIEVVNSLSIKVFSYLDMDGLTIRSGEVRRRGFFRTKLTRYISVVLREGNTLFFKSTEEFDDLRFRAMYIVGRMYELGIKRVKQIINMDDFLVSNLPYMFDYISELRRESWPDKLNDVFWKLVNDELMKTGFSTMVIRDELREYGDELGESLLRDKWDLLRIRVKKLKVEDLFFWLFI